MKQKILALVLAVFTFVCSIVPAFAADTVDIVFPDEFYFNENLVWPYEQGYQIVVPFTAPELSGDRVYHSFQFSNSTTKKRLIYIYYGNGTTQHEVVFDSSAGGWQYDYDIASHVVTAEPTTITYDLSIANQKKRYDYLLANTSGIFTPAVPDGYTYLTLDNGDDLLVPESAIDYPFIVNKYDTGSYYAYTIYEFRFIDKVYEGATCSWKQWETSLEYSADLALNCSDWNSTDCSNDVLIIDGLSDWCNEIVYSSFDYKDPAGNVLYNDSDDDSGIGDGSGSGDDIGDNPALGSPFKVYPAKEYYGLLPAVSTISDPPSDNWLVFREKYSDTGYQYWIYFFTDDFSIDITKDTCTTDGVYGTHPQFGFSAGTIFRYRLKADNFTDFNDIDDYMLQYGSNKRWSYFDTLSDESEFLFYPINGKLISTPEQWSDFLCDMFIASSVNVSVDGTTGYSYNTLEGTTVDYTLRGFYWEPTYYLGGTDDSGGSGGDTGDTGADDVSWLRRIYNAVVNGFQAVLDKLNNLGSDDTVNDPAINDNVIEPDENGEGGLSILDILKQIFTPITKLLGHIFVIIGDMLGDLVGYMTSFFGLLGDAAGDFFGFFDTENEDGFFSRVNTFYQFMHSLWSCIPVPIQLFTYSCVGFFLFFAVLKLFVH